MEFDFIVTGAGSAGCVIAARLAEAGAKVALLEAGRKDHHHLIHIPALPTAAASVKDVTFRIVRNLVLREIWLGARLLEA